MGNRKHWEPMITPEESKDVRQWWWKKEDKVGNVNCKDHATTSDKYREGWERTFGRKHNGNL